MYIGQIVIAFIPEFNRGQFGGAKIAPAIISTANPGSPYGLTVMGGPHMTFVNATEAFEGDVAFSLESEFVFMTIENCNNIGISLETSTPAW